MNVVILVLKTKCDKLAGYFFIVRMQFKYSHAPILFIILSWWIFKAYLTLKLQYNTRMGFVDF